MQQNNIEFKFPKASDFEPINEVDELADLEFSAAKQLLTELMMIKQSVYNRGDLTPMQLIQLKQVIRGLVGKYHNAGLLLDQDVTVKLSDYSKYPTISFKYTPVLEKLMFQVIQQLTTKKDEQ